MYRSRIRRAWLGAALCAGLVVAAVGIAPVPAGAYSTLQVGNCQPITWRSPPRILIHTTEWYAGNAGVDFMAMFGAVVSVAVDFNEIGATSAEIDYVNTTSAAFTFGTWYNDPTPTIHVGFTNDATVAPGAATAAPEVDANCQFDETHIRLQDPATRSWHFGRPDVYYTAQDTEAGAMYFNNVVLHELLHAFGLDHSDHSYSFMNANVYPWANRTAAHGVRPLPDDVRAMRNLYPAAGTRSEVAVLTTWYDPGSLLNGAAIQHGLCTPSLGTQFAVVKFFGPCGEGGPDAGSAVVCPDDRLNVVFTVANYSTQSVDLDIRVWFSTDDVFDLNDPLSPSQHTTDLVRADSDRHSRAWLVPANLVAGTEYFVIVEVAGTTSSGVSVEDWIPMRGTVEAGFGC